MCDVHEEVTYQDIGEDLQHEFPQLPKGSESWPLSSKAQVHTQDQRDSKGRLLAPCGCWARTQPPQLSQHPPFKQTPQNTERAQEWIIDYYAASSFNTCPHQELPKMSGLPPLRLLTKDNVPPVAVHKPSTIPAQDLEDDIALGVLERVPFNTPATWCSRMHVAGKKSGEPRRVVDIRALNKAT